MTERTVIADCENCESTFEISFSEEFVSSDTPNFCPFCGEEVETEDYSEEDDEDLDADGEDEDGDKWER